MPHPRSRALRALGTLALLTLIAGCTSPSGDQPSGEPSPSVSSSSTPSVSPSASASPSSSPSVSASASAAPSASPSSSAAPSPSASSPPQSPDPTLKEVSVAIAHIALDGDLVVVNASVLDAVEAGGTCLLEVTTASGSLTASVPASPDATSTWCEELSLSAPDAASGDEVTVEYLSATSSGRASSQIP